MSLTVAFTKLNKFVKRPVNPVKSNHDAVASIGIGAGFFTTLGMKAGYHQIPIRGEDKDFTTFITPLGRYRFKRAAMGLVPSRKIYNPWSNQFKGDIPRTYKVLDDVIILESEYCQPLRHVW